MRLKVIILNSLGAVKTKLKKNTSPLYDVSLYFSEATYRYSVLKRMEDQHSLVTEEDGDRGPCTAGEESDEVSASWLP